MYLFRISFIVVLSIIVSGCILVSKDQIYSTTPIGDELLSLSRAHETKVIGDDEYLQLRKIAMDRALNVKSEK